MTQKIYNPARLEHRFGELLSISRIVTTCPHSRQRCPGLALQLNLNGHRGRKFAQGSHWKNSQEAKSGYAGGSRARDGILAAFRFRAGSVRNELFRGHRCTELWGSALTLRCSSTLLTLSSHLQHPSVADFAYVCIIRYIPEYLFVVHFCARSPTDLSLKLPLLKCRYVLVNIASPANKRRKIICNQLLTWIIDAWHASGIKLSRSTIF